MASWECAIVGCGRTFQNIESLLTHQVTDHDTHTCEICGKTVPEGYFAISHVFSEHTRAEYVRFYDGDAAAVRRREQILEAITSTVDPTELERQLPDNVQPLVERTSPSPSN
ncbi:MULTISPECIES: hypothetical protein [Halobacterium]|uniref:DUF7565 family protein n=1 Tax=Halobacterium TaxID=2239 RepID=UPI0009E7C52E|nr:MULTISPECIES: hypothetical protein [Halobacterium]MCG1004927.1 hypothetical protein [Halobacterium noricense]